MFPVCTLFVEYTGRSFQHSQREMCLCSFERGASSHFAPLEAPLNLHSVSFSCGAPFMRAVCAWKRNTCVAKDSDYSISRYDGLRRCRHRLFIHAIVERSCNLLGVFRFSGYAVRSSFKRNVLCGFRFAAGAIVLAAVLFLAARIVVIGGRKWFFSFRFSTEASRKSVIFREEHFSQHRANENSRRRSNFLPTTLRSSLIKDHGSSRP